MSWPRLFHLGLLALALSTLQGCSDPVPALFPVEGTITRLGQPVREGGLIFQPVSGPSHSLILNAEVQTNGTFTVKAERTDREGQLHFLTGMPVGEYKVTYHPPSDGSKSGLEFEFPTTIKVEAKSNSLKLELPEKLPAGEGEPRDDDEQGNQPPAKAEEPKKKQD